MTPTPRDDTLSAARDDSRRTVRSGSRPTARDDTLSTTRAASLYIGALLGPGLLLLPGLAARAAGPASILAWAGLLALSALLAAVFSGLGTRVGSGSGVAGYAAAGLGARAGRATAWSFLAGAVAGAPVVCWIGGTYVAELTGTGRTGTFVASAALLAVVLAMRLAGARTGTGVQLALVCGLTVLVVVAVAGSAGSVRAAHWTPFAPSGWQGVARAASLLMLSFVGWEAVAPLTVRLRDPRRTLPRVMLLAFTVTAALYLGLAAATVGALGSGAGGPVPLADLLALALGSAGPAVAAAMAVALTLAATNAYLTGAAALASSLSRRPTETTEPTGHSRHGGHGGTRAMTVAIGVAGAVLLSLAGAGAVTPESLVTVPTALFLLVYLTCTAAGVRVLSGGHRAAAALSCALVALLLLTCGWAALLAVVVAVATAMATGRSPDE
ncbi:amino acid permease [Streptomyces sp. NPDC048172]|uniref:amino acid permease n=1 Tax=Streptomyces sp. NPDC048172 TaxID=3365505 RepID=UPI0037138174